jgi:outer membrane protein, multidrug efflux system
MVKTHLCLSRFALLETHLCLSRFALLETLVCIALLLALSACTVTPNRADIDRPNLKAQLPAEFDQAKGLALESTTQPARLSFSAFGSKPLDQLIDRAMLVNTSLAQVQARLDEARAYRGLTKFSLFPTVTGLGEKNRSRISSQDPQAPPGLGITESIDIGADVAWEIDLFGSLRNQSAAVVLRADAAQAALTDARRVVIAEVASGFFQALGARERVAITVRNLANLRESERIADALVNAGRGTDLDLARARSLRLSVEAGLATSNAEQTRLELRLATLCNLPVAELREVLAKQLEIPDLPKLRQVGTPEEWLKRRPDVQNAAHNLEAAIADAGAQKAEFFPKLNLLGNFGSIARSGSDVFSDGTARWRFGPSISWQFFNVGRVNQLYQAELAQARGAAASYEETVLRALEEVELAMANFRATQAATVALTEAAIQAEQARALAELRFEAGASDYLVVLDAQRQRLSLDDQLVQAKTARASALAMLYKALSGDFAELDDETD